MKTKFSLSLVITIAVALFSGIYSLCISAESQNHDDIFSNKQFYDKEELEDVMKSALESSPVSRGICSAEGLRNGHAYKVFLYSDGVFAEDLKTGKSMQEKLSSSEYAWVIDTDNVTLWIDKIEGAWKVTACSENSADDPGTVDFDAAEKAAVMLENEFGAEDISVQCLYSMSYFGRYLIFYSSAGEYVVPFSYRPDFTGLENGKLYPAAELGEILVRNLPFDPVNWFPEGNVNDEIKAPVQPKVSFRIDNPAVYIPAAFIPLLAGIGAVIYRKRRTA